MFMLEGNIGSGKSTFLSLVEKNLGIKVVYEPTDQWQKVGSAGNLLELFYRDMPRWAYTFQSYAFLSRVQGLTAFQDEPFALAERSIFCDRFCFAKNCFERGVMTEIEWQLYQEWFAWLAAQCMPRPHGFIYLRVSPEVCYERLKKRSRSEEEAVSLSYLKEIHKQHEDWLIEKKETLSFLGDVPTLVIDGTFEFEGDKLRQMQLMDQIDAFIKLYGSREYIDKKDRINKEKFDKQTGMFS